MAPSQQNKDLYERVNDGVMTRTMEGVINFWDRNAERLYGWRKEEAIGRVSHDLLQTQFPKPLNEIEAELIHKGRWEGKLVHTTRDGGRVMVESQWTLDPTEKSAAVVEINALSGDSEIDNKPPSKAVVFANFTLAAGVCFCLAVLLYCVYFYDVAGTRYFTSFAGVFFYQILPAGVALLLLAAFRLPSAYRINLALVLCSIGVSLFGAELLMAFYDARYSPSATLWGEGRFDKSEEKEIVALAKKFNTNFDFRSKLDVVRDLRKQDIQAIPTIAPVGLLKQQPDGTFKSEITIDGAEVLPLGGISNRTTVLCNETGEYAIYDSDERGFHNPKGIWESSRISIAAVGDSFTQGSCVASDKNFMALIRKQHTNTLNLGMSGQGPMIMLGALAEYLPVMKPKVVLWFFYEGNDFVDFAKESQAPLLRSYLEGNFKQNLLNRQPNIDEALIQYVEQYMKIAMAKKDEKAKKIKEKESTWFDPGTVGEFLRLSLLRQRLGLVYGPALEKPDAWYSQSQLDLFRSVLLHAKTLVEAWGGKLYFVYLPDRDRYANGQDYHRQSILAVVTGTGIPIIDVHARFQRESDPLTLFPFGRFGHYDEEGNRVVAEEVLRSISLSGDR
jgi:PAS domain S-box-containing protein